jgi:hypothetical protein
MKTEKEWLKQWIDFSKTYEATQIDLKVLTARLRELEAAEPDMDDVCAVCGERFGLHKQDTFNCPTDNMFKINGGSIFADTVFTPKPKEPPKPVTDDLLWQEIFSLREKLKIAVAALKNDNPDFDDVEFMHRLNAVDYDQLMEELASDGKPKDEPNEPAPGQLYIENMDAFLRYLSSVDLPGGMGIERKIPGVAECKVEPVKPRMEPYIKDKAAFEYWIENAYSKTEDVPTWVGWRPVEGGK